VLKNEKFVANRMVNEKIFAYMLSILLFITVLNTSVVNSNQDFIKGTRLAITNKNSGSLVVTLYSGGYTVDNGSDNSKIYMEDFGTLSLAGNPEVPSKTFYIGLPPATRLTELYFINETLEEIPGAYHILPSGQLLCNSSFAEEHENEEIYLSSEPYPQEKIEYLGMVSFRKYTCAKIRFSPITYYPLEGNLVLCKKISLGINYQKYGEISEALLKDEVMDDFASRIIYNYNTIRPFYTVDNYYSDRVTSLSAMTSSTLSSESYNYVIITTSALEYSVHDFKIWKESIGYSVKVVNTTWIEETFSGDDKVEKIRNFLRDKYISWGIKYVLLVGDLSAIPMRCCYPWSKHHPGANEYQVSDHQIPTDYYYANLSSDWNSDGDKYFGEKGQDDVGFYPDIYVGRIPSSSASEIEYICHKIINFEKDNQPWKKNALLLGSVLNYANELDKNGKIISSRREDYYGFIRKLWRDILEPAGFSNTTMFEKEGLAPSTKPCDVPLNQTNVLAEWSKGYGLVNWGGHGSPYAVFRKTWQKDDGDNIPEQINEVNTKEVSLDYLMRYSDTSDLDDSKPPIVFAGSCKTAWPKYTNNLGASLLKKGAVAYIGATRVTYYTSGWDYEGEKGVQTYQYYFNKHLVTDNLGIGDALSQAKFTYVTKHATATTDWAILLAFVLYGDPSLGLTTPIPCPDDNNPYIPHNPSPSNGFDPVRPITQDLSWTGGDPDSCSIVEYDVYLEAMDDTPDEIVSSSQQKTTFDPGILRYNTIYYWKIVAQDSAGHVTVSPIWHFVTENRPNTCPNKPYNPYPPDGSTDIKPHNVVLSWRSGETGEDIVRFDVYFEAGDQTPDDLVSTHSPWHYYEPGILQWDTHYFWKIVAADSRCTISGPVWDFWTRPPWSDFTLHDPIVIRNNLEFTPINGVIGGSGTFSNPYIISGWEIYDPHPKGRAILVTNTTSHFVIENCYIHEAGHGGINFWHVSNATVRTCIIEDCSKAIHSRANYGNCTNIRIQNNTITNNNQGIYMTSDSYLEYHTKHTEISVENNDIYNIGGDGIQYDKYFYNSVISGNNIYNTMGGIDLEYSTNNTIEDNIIRSGDIIHSNQGINILNSDHNLIRNNIIYDFESQQIRLVNASWNTITKNFAFSTSWVDYMEGIQLRESSIHNMISSNIVYNTKSTGILLGSSSCIDNFIINNTIYNCSEEGIEISSRNNVWHNTIYNINETGIKIDNADGGIIGWNTVYNCGVSVDDDPGITLSSCINILVVGNKVYDTYGTEGGIYLKQCSNINLSSNFFSHNVVNIYFSGGHNNIVYSNFINDSIQYGISIESSHDNLVYNNYFSNQNDYFLDDNSWDNKWNISKKEGLNIVGNKFLGGNRWTHCSSRDTDGDCLGDTELPYGPGDYLPLVPRGRDDTPPVIIDVTTTPNSAHIGDYVNISCRCFDNVGISKISATILYPCFDWENQNSLTMAMTNIVGTDLYYTNLSYSVSGSYVYYIVARDESNNTNTSSFRGFEICYPAWDVNGDGRVNILDMVLVGQKWLMGEGCGIPDWEPPDGYVMPEDINKDGCVNVLDMIFVGQYWTG